MIGLSKHAYQLSTLLDWRFDCGGMVSLLDVGKADAVGIFSQHIISSVAISA